MKQVDHARASHLGAWREAGGFEQRRSDVFERDKLVCHMARFGMPWPADCQWHPCAGVVDMGEATGELPAVVAHQHHERRLSEVAVTKQVEDRATVGIKLLHLSVVAADVFADCWMIGKVCGDLHPLRGQLVEKGLARRPGCMRFAAAVPVAKWLRDGLALNKLRKRAELLAGRVAGAATGLEIARPPAFP